ncbi:MAG: 2-hydroxyacid dehydrogenase, partial [Bdellovibrio sp.]|nr:2-hydroxyacid dehydrogenase [Bdellovibrio sp.]
MKVTFFDTHKFEKEIFTEINRIYGFELDFLDVRLSPKTVSLAAGAEAICAFVNDHVDNITMNALKEIGVRHIALRSAGFNNVDLVAAKNNNIVVSRVPAYSPYAVAEFATGLLLAVNRKIYRSFWRVRELNFSLDGLVGFDLHGKTVGVIGSGRIGKIFSLIMVAFGCRVLIYDIQKDPELVSNPKITYTDLADLCQQSDIISLHVPLTPETYHIINAPRIAMMKKGVILINTA